MISCPINITCGAFPGSPGARTHMFTYAHSLPLKSRFDPQQTGLALESHLTQT